MATLADQLLDSLVAVPTLFERGGVRSYVSLLPVHRGADILGVPGGGAMADHSWHASAEAQDSHTPLVLARADLSGDEIRQRMASDWKAEPTQLDFVSLVLRLLEAPE